MPISGPSHSSQALYAHPKTFTPISCTPCPYLAPPYSFLAFYTYPRPYTPVLGPPAAREMVLSAYKHVESANKFYIIFLISPILNQNIWVRVVISHPINDFSHKYMVPINSESFKTPSLTSHTLPKSKLSFFFFQKSNRYHNFEIFFR